ncbi:MAG: ABC transporter permease [Pseudomonadota bacterium]
MKQVLLIAWREYRQYVFSRGFLLFLIMFPLGFLGATTAVGLAERSKPVRYYVVFDQTGAYADAIVEEIAYRRKRQAIAAWDVYLKASGVADDALPEPFSPATPREGRVAAFDAAGGFEAANAAARNVLPEGMPPFLMPRLPYQLVELPPEARGATTLEEVEEALRPYLLEEKFVSIDGEARAIFAAVLIPERFGAEPDAPTAQYWSRNITDTELERRVSTALDNALKRERYTALGLDSDAIEAAEAISAPVASFRPDRQTSEAKLGLRDRIETFLPAAMTYMLLVIIFGVGNLLLTNTIEERSNKIVEILLSSVTANQLMMGKLLGIGAVGLTMPTVFIGGGIALSATVQTDGPESLSGAVMETLLSSNLLAVYLFYFLAAYVIFAMMFLAIGAVSNSLQDAQTYMGPLMLLVFAPLPFLIMVYENPNGFIASVLTWIPIYTPYAVMLRASADPPFWEIAGATALMLVFAIFLMRTMGRIFRNAILNASPPKMKDVLRLAKKQSA